MRTISPRLAPPCSQTVRAASFQHCQPKRRLPTIRLLPSGSTGEGHLTGGSFNSPSTTARATNSLLGKENVFRFCPKSDGILGMTSLNYEYNGSNYFMGFALRSGMLEHHENGNQRPETETAEKECARIIWAYAEQRLSSHCSLLLHILAGTGTPTGCRRYAGAGIVVQCGKTQGGIVLYWADFVNEKEWAAELTWKIPCLKRGYLQPALHLIRNDVSKRPDRTDPLRVPHSQPT